jgi:hypothetical protein
MEYSSYSSSSSLSLLCVAAILLFFNPDWIPFWLPIRWQINAARVMFGLPIKGGDLSSDFSMSDISDS